MCYRAISMLDTLTPTRTFDTAVQEYLRDTLGIVPKVRPWAGAFVSVAQLTTTREFQIMNCTVDDHSIKIYVNEPDREERARAVWQDIDRAFSEPVTTSDGTASYAPTQVLAEFFRNKGFDGIAYRSASGPGHNIALFGLDMAEVINCSLVEIRALTLEWRQAANPYFIAKHH